MNALEELILKVWSIELLGWIANIVVVIQFLMKDMWRLRVWGIIGASLWAVYGWGIGSVPLICLNLIIWIIQFYYLIKLSKERREKIDNDLKIF